MGPLLLSCVLLGLGVAAATPVNNAESLKAVSGAANTFSSNFLKTVSKTQTGNMVFSPLSVDMALSMLSFGAEGRTLQQLRNGLHMPDDVTLTKSGYKSLMNEFNNVQNVDLKLANKIFTSEQFELQPDYFNTVKDVFHSELQKLDFANSTAAADDINNWCKQQTNDRINKVVEPADLSGDTLMVLANGIYFKGQWADKFNSNLTRDMNFYLDKNTIKQVPMMFNSAEYNIGRVEGLDATFIELPYKGNEFSLVIIRPDNYELNDLIQNIHKVNMTEMLNRPYLQNIHLYLPKFKIESRIDLQPVLMEMGISDMFDMRANFSSMSDTPVVVSKAIHKAFIEVNEEGSEAAAVTATIMFMSMPAEIVLDHPFIATIVKSDRNERGEVQNAVIAFHTIIRDPTY